MYQSNKDYSDFYKYANKNAQYEYLNEKFGIPVNIQEKCGIGYVKEWENPLTLVKTPCIIIPHSDTSFSTIDTAGQHVQDYIGGVTPFNVNNGLKANFPFIVSDEITAMSVMAAGGEAIGLCSNDVSYMIDIFRKNNTKKQCFILALNDTTDGARIQQELIKKIETENLDIKFVEAEGNIPLNDMLKANKNDFKRFVTDLKERAAKTINSKTALKSFDIHKAIAKCCDFVCEPEFVVPTGFTHLDESLHGGFSSGLHFLGAMPSTGKTSFCVQATDQIAQQGIPVLFFSLEMNPKALVATSIARHTFLDNGNKTTRTANGTFYLAKDSHAIRSRQYAKYYTEAEKNAIRNAADKYKKYYKNITYYDRKALFENSNDALGNITQIIKDYAKIHNEFIVFIDYIQLLTRAIDGKFSERKAVDFVTNELKDISYNYGVPIVCISATNRSSYDNGASLSDFKESGYLEFTAETIMSLQIPGMDMNTGDSSEQKRRIRVQGLKDNFYAAKMKTFEGVPIQLKLLKSRNFTQQDLYFNAKYAFGYFKEITDNEVYSNTSTSEIDQLLKTKKRRSA